MSPEGRENAESAENLRDSRSRLSIENQEVPFHERVYSCRHGCGYVATARELSLHYRREHLEDKETQGDDREPTGEGRGKAPGGPSKVEDPRDEENAYLRKEVTRLNLELQRAEKEARLRRLDPNYGKGAPAEDEDTRFLVGLQKKRLLEAETKKVEAEAEAIRSPPGAQGDGDEMKALREEVVSLKDALHDREISGLRDGISALRAELRDLGSKVGNLSDRQFMIKEFREVFTDMKDNPGPVITAGAVRLGLVPHIENVPPLATGAQEEDLSIPSSKLERLRSRGLVTSVVRR